MARCFLTGVEFPLQKAFVLNRRDARDLLSVLKDRVASLQRVIDQLSPLDTFDDKPFERWRKRPFVPKRHRLVCKAVADALAPGFPEIELFQVWPEYRSRTRRAALHGRLHNPRVVAADTLAESAATAPNPASA